MEESNETLYIQNLNEKIKPEGKFHLEMRILLYQLFAQYGTVLEVNVQKQYRIRGQAFVVYDSKEDATNAMHLLQNYYFYGKPLRISFAKAKSDVIAKREGTFIPRNPGDNSYKRKAFFEKLKQKQATKRGQTIQAPLGTQLGEHNILFVEGLDSSITEHSLQLVFSLYEGLSEVRLIPEKQVAFVEFKNSSQANRALKGLNSYYFNPSSQFRINYAKR